MTRSFLTLLLLSAPSVLARSRTPFDFGFKFFLGDPRISAAAPVCDLGDPCAIDYNDSAWRNVNLPHDYGVESPFDPNLPPGSGSLPKNTSWYRKSFALPAAAAADELIYLEFDGAFRAVDVFLNGAFVAHHEEGYTPFIVWLHNATVPVLGGGATNTLAVFVDGRASELWSYEAMGITRKVWLHSAGALSAVPWSFFVPAQVTGAFHGSADAPQTADGALLSPQVDIANAGTVDVTGEVVFFLAAARTGALVCNISTPFSVPAGGWVRVVAQMACGSPAFPIQLWNTAVGGAILHDATALITASTGAQLDSVATRLGIRSALFTAADGFSLNGAKMVLRGFSNHVGFGGCGGAVPDRVFEFQLAMLQSIGGNAIRTAHNPVSREFLELADENGVLIWEENRFVTLGVRPLPPPNAVGEVGVDAFAAMNEPPPAAIPRLLQDCQDMVLRDRNHPSVIIWSLCNELGCLSNSPTGHIIAAQFKQAIYYADNTRPVTGNIVQRPYLSGRLIDEFGLSMDVTAFSHENQNVLDYRAETRWKPVGLGESGSCESDRGEYADNDTTGHIGFNAQVIKCFAVDMVTTSLPYNFGAFSWTFNDYLGETDAPATVSHYGLFDIAGFPKDAAGYFTAAWVAAPAGDCDTITLANSDWTAPVAFGTVIDVIAFTCSPSAELFLNGQSIGVQPVVGEGVAVSAFWRVPFAPGNLTAVAINAAGTRRGSVTILSAGAPVRLLLTVESPYRAPRNGSIIAADGSDAAILTVTAVDANGFRVPTAALNVSFTVRGPAAVYGVINGDPADLSPVKGVAWRFTYHGLARLIISSTGGNGPILVTATSDGVSQATASLIAQ